MLKFARLFQSAAQNHSASPPEIDCPDLIQEHKLIAACLKQQSQTAQNGLLIMLIEGENISTQVIEFQSHSIVQTLEMDLSQPIENLLGKTIHLLGFWHEYRISFSVTVLQQLGFHRYQLSWPSELVRSLGRETFRARAPMQIEVRLRQAQLAMTGQLIDLSEGGAGIKLAGLAPLHHGQVLQLDIHFGQQQIHLPAKLCTIIVDQLTHCTRIGVSFQAAGDPQLSCIRKMMLQLQSRH